MRKLIVLVASVAVAGALAVPASGASTKTIKIGDNFFKPKTLTVKKGTKLVFKWTGKAPHNVTGAGLKSGTKSSGTYKVKAKKSGKIVCTIHPGMEMRLKVK